MVRQKCSPGLRRRFGRARDVLRDRGLTDVNAQFEQLAVNPRGAPQRIGVRHRPNQRADVGRHDRSADASSTLPGPHQAEALAMPRNDRVLCENSAEANRSTNRRIRRDRRTLVSRNSIQPEGARCRIWRALHRATLSGRLAPSTRCLSSTKRTRGTDSGRMPKRRTARARAGMRGDGRNFSPTSVHERPNTAQNRGAPETREQDDSTR